MEACLSWMLVRIWDSLEDAEFGYSQGCGKAIHTCLRHFPSHPPLYSNHPPTTTATTTAHIPIPIPPILPLPLIQSACCTFSLNRPTTFPPGQYSHTRNQPGASPSPPGLPPLHIRRAQPSEFVAFHTSCVKWPVAVLRGVSEHEDWGGKGWRWGSRGGAGTERRTGKGDVLELATLEVVLSTLVCPDGDGFCDVWIA